MNNLVSIIIPSYNAELYIEETLLSVIAQDYTNWECVIIDDHSADSTVTIVNDYINKFQDKIRLFTNTGKGACAARNLGIQNSRGKYYKFLDSDDVLYDSEVLGKQVRFIEEGNYDIVYGTEVYYQDKFEEENVIKHRGKQVDLNEPATFWENFPITSNFLLRGKADVARQNFWNETLKAGQEFYFLFNYFLNDAKFGFLNFKAVKIRVHDSPHRISNSPKKNKMENVVQLASLMNEEISRFKPNNYKLKAHYNFVVLLHSLDAHKEGNNNLYEKLRTLLFSIPASKYSFRQRTVLSAAKISPSLGNIVNKVLARLKFS